MIEPKNIELEITSKCTLYCPDCARTKDKNETLQKWNFGEVPLHVIERVVATPAKTIILSGCYGDPIYHTKFHDVIKIIKSAGKKISINTNGSYRNQTWWQETADLFDQNDIFIFSIDGLPGKDQYRVNADWPSMEAGIKTMTSLTKAYVQWKWIIFKYNENDIIEGYKLSKELGFDDFILVDSGRDYPVGMQPTRSFDDCYHELMRFKINAT